MTNTSTKEMAEVKAFEKIVPMTTSEKNLVDEWVAEGHSPFTNPFGLVNLDGGCMLNFIQAVKENPFVDEETGKGGRRYGNSDIIRLSELVTPGWEEKCQGLLRARI